jgi:outer membrane protein insertion porin family
MKSLVTTAALLFLLSSSPAIAADLVGLPVTSVKLKDDQGRDWPSPERLMPLIETKPGLPLSREDVRRSIEYLMLKGLFKDVIAEGFADSVGVRLEYTLVPVTIVRSVAISGNSVISTKALRKVLDKLEGKELRDDRYTDLRVDIAALYQEAGYYDGRVLFRTEPADEPRQVILRVEIAESEPTLIEEITFSGNRVFTGKQLLKVMKSRPGSPLRTDLLLDHDTQAIMQKYAGAGYPAAKADVVNMSLRDKKAYLHISGEEGPLVTVAFSGNEAFSDKRLRKELLIWAERDVSEAVLDSSIDKIRDLYRKEGYPDSEVKLAKDEASGKLHLSFSIFEGPKVAVQEIFIEGNHAFSGKQLKEFMVTREDGWFRSGLLNREVLDRDVDDIRARYADAGYLDARVDRKVLRPGDGKKAIVSIKIEEGLRSITGDVTFSGNTVFTTAELLGRLSLRPGAPYSERQMEEDRYRLLSAYSAKGYLYARVEAGRPRNGEKQNGTAASGSGTALFPIQYAITEDHPVTIGKIILRGNEATRDHVIMREILVAPGDAYNYESILGSQQRIYRLGFFGLARFEPLHPGKKEPVKDMLLSVEERPAGAFEFGLGYGDVDLYRGFMEVSHRNLWGQARYASFRVERSDIVQRAIFNFREPWFLGAKLDSAFSLSWSDSKKLDTDTREIYYETRKTSASFGVEKNYDGLRPSLVYQYENVENYNVKPEVVPSKEDQGRVLISSLTPGISWDLRDNFLNPMRGSFHSIAVKEALTALGSEADFTKATAQTSWFLPSGRRVVFALSGRAGKAWPHGDTLEIPLHERFYLGGSTTVRGYRQDLVGPTNSDAAGNPIPTGGSSMVVFNAEMRLNPQGSFGLVFFYDAGNVWADSHIDFGDLRASYGAGIRYNTPVGPLRLDYGQKINRQAGEAPGEFHFSIGHTF